MKRYDYGSCIWRRFSGWRYYAEHLSGAACVISSRYVETKAHDYKDMREITQKLVFTFQERMGSRLCSQIKPVFHTKETKCENTVAISAEV